MTKRIRHVSELPAWFDLKKYEFTTNLDSLGWFNQLISRGLYFAKVSSTSNDIAAEAKHELTLKKFIPLVRNNPNLCIGYDTALWLFALIYDDTLQNNTFEQYLGVYPVKSKKSSIKSMTDLYYVNHNFCDEYLIERFKRCLANTRRKRQSIYSKPYRKSDFQNWVKLGVLPYIDLFVWSREEKRHITHRVLANALYPYGDKGEETIRKTTIPLVDAIVSPYSMMQLHAQARTSIIENN